MRGGGEGEGGAASPHRDNSAAAKFRRGRGEGARAVRKDSTEETADSPTRGV